MADPVRIEIVNLDEWKQKLARMSAALADQAVIRALTSGAEIIRNAAVQKAPFKTGNLRRSLHIEPGDGREVLIGTNLDYAAIQEFGGIIKAKNGPYLKFKIGDQWVQTAQVQIPARPYLRPAFDENRDAAIREVGEALAQLLEAAT